ncbi:hypothetical protein K439DRAFT_1622251 [Ramaria rubella]|nr:hypothetical protein K439DRAFT_1622251 [Ramaria rubella]
MTPHLQHHPSLLCPSFLLLSLHRLSPLPPAYCVRLQYHPALTAGQSRPVVQCSPSCFGIRQAARPPLDIQCIVWASNHFVWRDNRELRWALNNVGGQLESYDFSTGEWQKCFGPFAVQRVDHSDILLYHQEGLEPEECPGMLDQLLLGHWHALGELADPCPNEPVAPKCGSSLSALAKGKKRAHKEVINLTISDPESDPNLPATSAMKHRKVERNWF